VNPDDVQRFIASANCRRATSPSRSPSNLPRRALIPMVPMLEPDGVRGLHRDDRARGESRQGQGPEDSVLVAEDDADIRELLCALLEPAGYSTLRASDGEQALRLARDHLPRACILDVVLPKLGGLDVLRELRCTPATAEIPVIILSAGARAHDIEQGFRAGANDYMTKPFSPAELLRRLAALSNGA
jgi:CheY-like chemotaxis protein